MADSNDTLTDMVSSLIQGDNEQAEQSFHDYLKPKMQSTINPIEDDSTNKEQ